MRKKIQKELKNKPERYSSKRVGGRQRGTQNQRFYQFKICLWLALGKTTAQIVDLLEDRLDFKTTAQNVDKNYRYGKKWQKTITYLRTRFLNNISRIPIANKARRLQALNEALEEAFMWRTKSVSQWGIVKEKKIGLVASLVKEAREEKDGKASSVPISLDINANVKIDVDLEHTPTPDLIKAINNRLLIHSRN